MKVILMKLYFEVMEFMPDRPFELDRALFTRKTLMSATMTALQKPDGARHCHWHFFRRLVAKTPTCQFGETVESTCAPFQFALSSRHWVKWSVR